MEWIKENLSWLIPSFTGILGTVLGSLLTHWLDGLDEKRNQKVTKNKELEAKIVSLETELKAYKDLDEFRNSLEYIDTGIYQRIVDKDNESYEYYCSRCFDESNKRIRINIHENGDYVCPVCKNTGLFNAKMRDLYNLEMERKTGYYNQQIDSFIKYGNI